MKSIWGGSQENHRSEIVMTVRVIKSELRSALLWRLIAVCTRSGHSLTSWSSWAATARQRHLWRLRYQRRLKLLNFNICSIAEHVPARACLCCRVTQTSRIIFKSNLFDQLLVTYSHSKSKRSFSSKNILSFGSVNTWICHWMHQEISE